MEIRSFLKKTKTGVATLFRLIVGLSNIACCYYAYLGATNIINLHVELNQVMEQIEKGKENAATSMPVRAVRRDTIRDTIKVLESHRHPIHRNVITPKRTTTRNNGGITEEEELKIRRNSDNYRRYMQEYDENADSSVILE